MTGILGILATGFMANVVYDRQATFTWQFGLLTLALTTTTAALLVALIPSSEGWFLFSGRYHSV